MARVDQVCAREEADAVVVFDRGAGSLQGTSRVHVRVAEAGQIADDVIRALIDAAPPGALTVVTSDKPLYSYARTRGALVLRAHEWKRLERG